MSAAFATGGTGKSNLTDAARTVLGLAAVDAMVFGTGGVMTHADGSVTRLSPADLDRMAIGVHLEDDPDFGIPSFAAYAPDPDRDYNRGRDAGYQEGYQAAINEGRMVRWHDATRIGWLDLALVAGSVVAIGLLMWLGGRA